MNKRWYILIKDEKEDPTFVDEKGLQYEIYYIPATLIPAADIKSSTIVYSVNQSEALEYFNKKFSIFKIASKDYYEKELRIQM